MYDYRCPYWLSGSAPPQFGASTHWFNTASASSNCPNSRQINSWGLASLQEAWQFATSLDGHLLLQTSVVDAAGGVVTRQTGGTAVSPSDPVAIAELARETRDYIGAGKVDFEIGNEPEIYIGWAPTSTNCEALAGPLPDGSGKTYVQKFVEQANAIHANNPTSRVIGPATGTLACLGVFLRELSHACPSGCLDGVSVHYYPSAGIWASLSQSANFWKTGSPYDGTGLTPNMPAIRSLLQTYGFASSLPVLITEWNQGVLIDAWGDNSSTTMQGALLYADYMAAFASSGVDTQTYHSMHDARPGKPGSPGGYTGGMFTGLGDHEVFGDPIDIPMPTFYAERIWSTVGPSLISTNKWGGDFVALGAKDDEGNVQVLLIEKSGSDQYVTVSGFSQFLNSALAPAPAPAPERIGDYSGVVVINTLTPANGNRSDEIVWQNSYYSSVSSSWYTYLLRSNSIALLTFTAEDE
jgi:hypothetical protein